MRWAIYVGFNAASCTINEVESHSPYLFDSLYINKETKQDIYAGKLTGCCEYRGWFPLTSKTALVRATFPIVSNANFVSCVRNK